MKIKKFNESINVDKVVIKDEFLNDLGSYIGLKVNNILVDLGFLGYSLTGIFKGRIATSETFNKKLSILYYNIKGKDIEFKFPTKKLMSAEEYEMYDTANKYNL
jgi:hypothetical protein